MSARRVRWEVCPVRGTLLWALFRNGVEKDRRFFKFRVVEAGRASCRFELDEFGTHSELMVKNRKGHYTSEGSTYGSDPREIQG